MYPLKKIKLLYSCFGLIIVFVLNKFAWGEYTIEEEEFIRELLEPEPVDMLSEEEWASLLLLSPAKPFYSIRQQATSTSSSSMFSFAALGIEDCPQPGNFPPSIPIQPREFKNWAENIKMGKMWVAVPRTYKDIILLANWAYLNDYMLRAKGYSNSWAPFTISRSSLCSNTILVDTTQFLVQMKMLSSKGSFRAVQVQTGATIESLLTFLEDHKCALFSSPVMGEITVGGALALSCHGSGIGNLENGPSPPAGFSTGSLSNLILSFKAIIWDYKTETYVMKKFSRTERDSRAFLTHLGRAFITQVTLLVGPAYKLRCQTWSHLSAQNLLSKKPLEQVLEDGEDDVDLSGFGEEDYFSVFDLPEEDESEQSQETFASLVEKYHSVDLSVFPYTDHTLLMACTNRTKFTAAKVVSAPYPFSYLENVPKTVRLLLSQFLSGRHYLAPMISRLNHQFNSVGLRLSNNQDICGQSKNMLLRYNSKQALSHSFSSGYAIITHRQNIQKVMGQVYNYYKELVEKFSSNWKYPQNEPIQFTVTGLDDPKHLPPFGRFDPPSLSFLAPLKKSRKRWDVAVIVNINVHPGTQNFDKFMRELESFLFLTYDGESDGLVRPEWSKAWAFTDDGAWDNPILLKRMIPKSFGSEWEWAVKKLNYYDPHQIFTNEFINHLLQPPSLVNHNGMITPAPSTSSNIKSTFASFLSWAKT